ncbi:Cell division protein FtsQ [Sulfitobacter noctilucicola]|uniref:Cell division protein FtsQ n=1 Tax=Sulfitobacter noctilucicola TaxID=1342301 RepID=A0A7W6M883_9RHOB|nr:cell division protein FtsQ/DivIB [Sulfitobacter noctilucicola]KIN64598.1 Cell division protein FtsQ [Sulfitobacter noctilucicola]MBB4174251.1 cell division protein FtsQ [Sulfitobacter noctilucicola]
MRSLMSRKKPLRSDPAPSRWAWRMQRLMLTPGFRLALRAGVPFCLTLMAGTIYLSNDDRRMAITQAVADARASIEERPEFMVKLMAIDGAEGDLAAEIRTLMPLELPQSSFDLDLSELRAKIKALPGVKTAAVRIKPGGILHIDVAPRVAVVIWRNDEGLTLLDEGGALVAYADARTDRPDLPLIAGEGAARHVPEALDLMRAATALGERVRGVVRMGDRRWDVVLDRDQRIMLPENGALPALERVIALERAQEVLTRDVARVDMRLGKRPTIRMNADAQKAWWSVKQEQSQ